MNAEISSKKGFYIGDICYVLPDNIYYGIWGDQHGYEDGAFEAPGTGLKFAVAGTAYGDGRYDGKLGSYPVDAGVIGVVPLELVKEDATPDEDGTVVHKPGIAIFEEEDGVFTIRLPDGTEEVINTDPQEEYEEDDEDYEDEDEDEEDEDM